MFTGIISATSTLSRTGQGEQASKFTIKRPKGWGDLALGESVAVNGICLTVNALSDDSFEVMVVPETLKLTSFGKTVPSQVNLERALKLNDRLSGHFVAGHVDGMGTVKSIDKEAGEWRVNINFNPQFKELVVSKGSITVAGVALTIAELDSASFSVALVPFTLSHTTLGDLHVGDPVNLEFDMLGKYVLNSLKGRNK